MKNAKHLLTASRAVAARIGEGLFSYAVDVAVWNAVFLAELSLPQSSTGQIWRAHIAADRFLNQWNYKTMKTAFANARRKKLLQPVKRGRHSVPTITEAGKRRLSTIIPVYDTKRVWDGRMHLVTYDVIEKKRLDRDALRRVIQQLGAGRLQDSVWITPYNPIDTLRDFLEKRRLAGSVIVSDMGRDGAIGEEDLGSLVIRVWRLDLINDRYNEWLRECKKMNKLDQWLVTKYLSVLHDDPQLPFPLLPKWWIGDKAYRMVAPKLKQLYLTLRPRR